MKIGRPRRRQYRTLADLELPKTGYFFCDRDVGAEVMLIKSGAIPRSFINHHQSSHSVSPDVEFFAECPGSESQAADWFGTVPASLRNRMPILGRISPGRRMLQLPLDIAQQSAGSKAEHFRTQP